MTSARELGRPRDPRQHATQLRQVDRLQQVIGRAVAHRLDRAFERRVSGDDDHLRVDVAAGGFAQQLQPVAIRQYQVEQDDVGRRAEQVAGALNRIRAGGRETLAADKLGERLGGVGVVIDNQSVGHFVQSTGVPPASVTRWFVSAQGPYRCESRIHVPESPPDSSHRHSVDRRVAGLRVIITGGRCNLRVARGFLWRVRPPRRVLSNGDGSVY